MQVQLAQNSVVLFWWMDMAEIVYITLSASIDMLQRRTPSSFDMSVWAFERLADTKVSGSSAALFRS